MQRKRGRARHRAVLRLNVHFYTLVLEGAYSFDKNNRLRFYPLPAPSDDEVYGLLQGVSQKIEKLARKDSNAQDTANLPDGKGKVLAVISAPLVVTPSFKKWSSPRLVKAPRLLPSPNLRHAARPSTPTSNLRGRGESGRASGHARPVDWPLFALARMRA
jgi:hypothetical protein